MNKLTLSGKQACPNCRIKIKYTNKVSSMFGLKTTYNFYCPQCKTEWKYKESKSILKK